MGDRKIYWCIDARCRLAYYKYRVAFERKITIASVTATPHTSTSRLAHKGILTFLNEAFEALLDEIA